VLLFLGIGASVLRYGKYVKFGLTMRVSNMYKTSIKTSIKQGGFFYFFFREKVFLTKE